MINGCPNFLASTHFVDFTVCDAKCGTFVGTTHTAFSSGWKSRFRCHLPRIMRLATARARCDSMTRFPFSRCTSQFLTRVYFCSVRFRLAQMACHRPSPKSIGVSAAAVYMLVLTFAFFTNVEGNHPSWPTGSSVAFCTATPEMLVPGLVVFARSRYMTDTFHAILQTHDGRGGWTGVSAMEPDGKWTRISFHETDVGKVACWGPIRFAGYPMCLLVWMARDRLWLALVCTVIVAVRMYWSHRHASGAVVHAHPS